MRVETATRPDLSSILEILNKEIEGGYAHFATEPIAFLALEAQFNEESPRYPWFVAQDDSGVVGFARSSPWKSRGAYAPTAEIGVYVRENRRGVGVGRAIYGHFMTAMEAAGFHTLLGGIALPNPGSVALHESFGFVHVGTLPEVGWKHGEWRSVGYWAKVFPKT